MVSIDVEAIRKGAPKISFLGGETQGPRGLIQRLSSRRSSDAALEAAVDFFQFLLFLTFDGASFDNPYRSAWVLEGKRSLNPDDFSDEVLELLESLQESDLPLFLKARVRDIAFYRLVDGDRRDRAQLACSAFLEWIETCDDWLDCESEWRRCYEIARRFKFHEVMARLGIIVESRLFNGVQNVDARVARDVRDAKAFHLIRGDVAWVLHVAALESTSEDYKEFLIEEAISWCEVSGRHELKFQLVEKLSDMLWVRAHGASSALEAVDLLKRSFREMGRIPISSRSDRVTARMREFGSLLDSWGRRRLDEMERISTGPIDLSIFDDLRECVLEPESHIDALFRFWRLVPVQRLNGARSMAESVGSGLLGLVNNVQLDHRGREVSNSKSMKPGFGVSVEVWQNMMRAIGFHNTSVVVGYIAPLMPELQTRWPLRQAHFDYFVQLSPYVPNRLRGIVSLALYEGFWGRFTIALHLLCPALEESVREYLKARGMRVRGVDKDGVESDLSLSALLAHGEAMRHIPEDIIWNLRSLFADPLGPNLRNRVAHGLLDEGEGESPASIYAWWLIFGLVFDSFVYQKMTRVNNVFEGEV